MEQGNLDISINETTLPTVITDWFASRGWAPHEHQLHMLEAANKGQSALLVAPTGGGKTMAGFLPSLIDLIESPDHAGTHTLYISPLKALTTDIGRNLQTPVSEMGLGLSIGIRTGDTSQAERKKQSANPPSLYLTTPESL
ncbi:MAG: DEAD/DEAH box helicase, partial [Alphaproteobacteria bacterium]